MDSLRYRDPLFASLALGVLIAVLVQTGQQSSLLRPVAAMAGVCGAVVLEVAFLRYPDQLLSVWQRRGVAVAATLTVLAVGVFSLLIVSVPVLAGMLAWGLATYLLLALCVVVGLGNPLAPLAGEGGR